MREIYLKALLIEDSKVYAQLVLELIKEARGAAISLDIACRLQDGIAKLQKEHFDVILLDLTLPDCFGIETIHRARAAAGHIPIIILTSLDDDEFIMQSLQSGAQDYLIKGEFDTNLLVRSILYSVERKKAELALLESEELLSVIFREIPSLIAIITLNEGLYVDVNNAFEAASGYSRDELVARPSGDPWFFATGNEKEAIYRRLQNEELIKNQTVNFRTRSGEVIPCLASFRRISIKGRPCVLSVLSENSERKRSEEASAASISEN
ncbi:MAG: response regulator [Syntrophothermus sp.]